MLDSTTNLKSPQFQKSIKSKQELQSFYHYSKIMKLKELTQKPSQLSINYNLSQHNSIGLRQSDHISNFELLIQQNSRYNYHRQIREQYQYHSQSALTNNLTEKINWQKHKENQKKIEQALNKYKFNHSLENNQQSITRRRIQRLSSETSTQSKFFIESRPTSKQRSQLQNQILIDSKQKKQSIKAASTQHQTQIDQYDYEISPKNQNLENLVNKILDSKQEQQSEMNEDYDQNEGEEEQEFIEQINEKQIMNQIEGRYEQIEKQLDNNLRRQLNRNIVKQDNIKNEQEQIINKQTTQKLQQTKKKLKASIQQQLQNKSDQLETVAPLQQRQQTEVQTVLSPKKINDEKQLENNEEYIKQLREEQKQYKQDQQILQKEEEKNQQIKLLEIKKIQEEIEKKKNKKEDFIYQIQENNTEEQFIKKQQQLKLDIIEQQKKEEERLLREQQLQREKDEQLNRAKQFEEEKQKQIEENKKKELAQLIQKQKDEIEKQVQEEMAKQPPKLEKQKSVLIIPKQIIQERKKSQEEIETSNRQIKREIESKIQKQKEEDEKEELEKLDFVEYMLRSKSVYDVNYDKFKLYEDKLKKVKEPPNYLEEDELNIYHFLKIWKQVNKKGSIKMKSLQIKENQDSIKT